MDATVARFSIKATSLGPYRTSSHRNVAPGSSRVSHGRPCITSLPVQSESAPGSTAKETQISKRMSGVFFQPLAYPSRRISRSRNHRVMKACPRVNKQPFRKIPEGPTEKSFYTLLVDAIRPFAPGLEVVDTSQHPSGGIQYRGCKLRPDVALYSEGCGCTRITDFELMDLFLEVKSSDKFEAFEDPPQEKLSELSDDKREKILDEWKFEYDTVLGTRTRGQITAHALTQLGSQLCHFVLSVAIIGKNARLAVTEMFNYTEQPRLLADFFWRFSLSNPEHRGMDKSVTEVE
ncbi:hypothetical protein K503DRAFT_749154, partial [Rhizopogon vinicolor AM-OR11-026]